MSAVHDIHYVYKNSIWKVRTYQQLVYLTESLNCILLLFQLGEKCLSFSNTNNVQ